MRIVSFNQGIVLAKVVNNIKGIQLILLLYQHTLVLRLCYLVFEFQAPEINYLLLYLEEQINPFHIGSSGFGEGQSELGRSPQGA